MSAQNTARKASKAFYEALNRMVQGDAGPMMEIWSHSAGVTTMHPLGGRNVGWAQVKGPWGEVAKSSSGGRIELRDPLIRVSGDMAFEVGFEQGHIMLGRSKVKIGHRVTNVYRREASGWKIVHHHTDLSPEMAAALKRLQAKK